MPRALAIPVRRVLLQRWQRGESVSEIAAALAVAPRTVRSLIRRWQLTEADSDPVLTAYERCGWHRSWPNQRLVDAALALRRQHPTWGAGLIRVFLQRRWGKQRLPTPRTLQRWFGQAGLGPAPRGRRPRGSHARATRPHEVWEVDAVEQLRLRQGQKACWLRVTDEGTGAILQTEVFPIGCWAQVGASAVQVSLRKAFTRRGRPQRVRVDNGAPWERQAACQRRWPCGSWAWTLL